MPASSSSQALRLRDGGVDQRCEDDASLPAVDIVVVVVAESGTGTGEHRRGIRISGAHAPRARPLVAPGSRAVWVEPSLLEEPRPVPIGFQVLPQRWVVERTFAWLGRYRRLSKDDEELPTAEEAWISLAMSMLMLARLAK